jgi:hypothetical protein
MNKSDSQITEIDQAAPRRLSDETYIAIGKCLDAFNSLEAVLSKIILYVMGVEFREGFILIDEQNIQNLLTRFATAKHLYLSGEALKKFDEIMPELRRLFTFRNDLVHSLKTVDNHVLKVRADRKDRLEDHTAHKEWDLEILQIMEEATKWTTFSVIHLASLHRQSKEAKKASSPQT